MDGCSRQDPAYRPATESPREGGGFLFRQMDDPAWRALRGGAQARAGRTTRRLAGRGRLNATPHAGGYRPPLGLAKAKSGQEPYGGADVSHHHQDPDSERRLLPALPSPDREAKPGRSGRRSRSAARTAGCSSASGGLAPRRRRSRARAAAPPASSPMRPSAPAPTSPSRSARSARPSATSRRRWGPGPSGS